VELEGQGSKKLVIYLDDQKEVHEVQLPHVVDIPMGPRSVCLIELH
jgi:hypothetical protein